jgi:hypothetical protein
MEGKAAKKAQDRIAGIAFSQLLSGPVKKVFLRLQLF